MEHSLLGWTLGFISLATVAMSSLFSRYWTKSFFRTAYVYESKECISNGESAVKQFEDSHGNKKPCTNYVDENVSDELEAIKQLYFRLHHLEQFPEVLPQAKRLLLFLIKETSTAALVQPASESILSVTAFSRQHLAEFQRRRDIDIGKDWQEYNVRRKEGAPRELFENRGEAIWWLKQISPVKYVDGAWLGHIGKVTTPFALQKTMKGAWQILSEELGDGDLEKNHAHLYHTLLERVAPGFPTAAELDFAHSRHQLDELPVWKAAIAQLLISLFPKDFLPEILGFNMHFEAVSMDTLKAGRELREVGIDPYYFILHISIDNADSGHTAIALEIVCEYMDYVRREGGEVAVQEAWERVQRGYLLSVGLPGTTICPSRRDRKEDCSFSLNLAEREVIKIFRAKAQVVHGIHCSCKVRIGTRSVVEWLDPVALESKKWQRELLDALSCSKYWVCKGNSSESRFIRELQWNGRMFGSFTQDEYDVLRKWIDDMSNAAQVIEEPKIEQNIEDDILSGNPVFRPLGSAKFQATSIDHQSATTLFSFQDIPLLKTGNRPALEKFLPLWLSHPCLLQTFVSVPFWTTNKFACTIIKILRAQGGFHIEQECVAGMGEVRRPNSLGLAGIGLNIIAHNGLSSEALPSLQHVLRVYPSDFAVHMLHISMRPMEYKGLLIGMATAFAKMHCAVAERRLHILAPQDLLTLQKIAEREMEGLETCWTEMTLDAKMHSKCCEGYIIARHEIEKCFRS